MTTNGIINIIIYQYDNNDGSYKYKKSYNVCIGTMCEELGFSSQFSIDLSRFLLKSNKSFTITFDKVFFSYEFPKTIDNIYLNFLNLRITSLSPKTVLDSPLIVFVDSNFNYDIINKYIETYKEYDVKEII